jgi:hypothetical protein
MFIEEFLTDTTKETPISWRNGRVFKNVVSITHNGIFSQDGFSPLLLIQFATPANAPIRRTPTRIPPKKINSASMMFTSENKMCVCVCVLCV